MNNPSYADKAAFFDAQAREAWADNDYGVLEQGKLARLIDLLAAAPGMALLEPGCGTGRLTRVLGEIVGPEGSVLAMDISGRMVEIARERCAGLDQVRIVQADLETCELPDPGFDAVACHQVFPHFNDRPRSLRRFAECLNPSGRLVISHFISRESINDVHRKAGTAVERDLLPDAEEMRSLLAGAGFEIDLLEDGPDEYFLAAHLAR